MNNFKGDLSWIRKWEGHIGKPYWPKGQSGVTLDPGVDLGYVEWQRVRQIFCGLNISELQFTDLERMADLTGANAERKLLDAYQRGTPLTTIRIERSQADSRFEFVVAPYWDWISERFPALLEKNPPAAVHTIFLSLAFNRGPNNSDLEQLRKPLDSGAWREIGTRVAAMQQDHELRGIRRRRREEGDLLLT